MNQKDDDSEAPQLPRDAQARIGARLRQMYDSVVQEPVPDRFKALLDQLQSAPKAEAQSAPKDSANEPDAPRP